MLLSFSLFFDIQHSLSVCNMTQNIKFKQKYHINLKIFIVVFVSYFQSTYVSTKTYIR